MTLEWLPSGVIVAVASATFGDFETVRPLRTRIVRWWACLAVNGLLRVTVGRPWTLLWVLGLPATGVVFHAVWCRRQGINALTAEPRERYEQLRAHHTATRAVR